MSLCNPFSRTKGFIAISTTVQGQLTHALERPKLECVNSNKLTQVCATRCDAQEHSDAESLRSWSACIVCSRRDIETRCCHEEITVPVKLDSLCSVAIPHGKSHTSPLQRQLHTGQWQRLPYPVKCTCSLHSFACLLQFISVKSC